MPAAAKSLCNPRHRRLIPGLGIHDPQALGGQALPSDLPRWNPDHHVILWKLKYAARRIRDKWPLKHLR